MFNKKGTANALHSADVLWFMFVHVNMFESLYFTSPGVYIQGECLHQALSTLHISWKHNVCKIRANLRSLCVSRACQCCRWR